MPLQFVTGKYNFDGSITIFARNELGVKEPLKILGFKPYFYVPQDEPIGSVVEGLRKVNLGFRGVYGEETKQLVMRSPSDVGNGRDFFSKHWEAGVRFIRRFIIDMGITSGFDTLVKGKKVLHYKDLIPCEFSLKALENFLDIECYTSGRFPNPNRASEKVTCATVWDTRLMCYITILLDPDASNVRTYEELAEDHRLYRVRTEQDLLLTLKRYYVRLNPDIGAEWNKFDFDFVKVRGKRHGIDFSCFESVCLIDMLEAYARLYKKASNRLKDVVFDEGIIDWIEPEVNYGKLWEEDKMGLVERNKRHVEWMVKLNEKKAGGDLLGHFWDRKNIVGLEGIQETLYPGVLVHTLMLRGFHGKYVLPTKVKRTKGEDLTGALVKKPPVGMFKDVAVFDMWRYYPNIIIALNLSPENPPEGVRGIVPEVCQYLIDERDKYDKQLVKLVLDSPEYKSLKSVRDGIKYVGEGVIGCFGSLNHPLYNPSIFKKVLSTSRNGLLELENAVEERGFRSLYYDTDGVYVHMNGGDPMRLALELNKVMTDWGKEQGMNTDLKLKCDRVFRNILFKGVKKRLAGLVSWEDGKDYDYLYIQGFDYVRRSSSLVTRKVQRETFEKLLRGKPKELIVFLQQTIRDMKGGKYTSREVAIKVTLSKKLKSYKAQMDYVRGSIYANHHLGADIRGGDTVHMLYVNHVGGGKPLTDVLCFLDEEQIPKGTKVNWRKMIDRTVKGKVEDLIALGGLSWAQVKGTRKLTEVF